MPAPLPSRLVGLPEARRLYGTRVDELAALLFEVDPLGDRAAALLRRDGWSALGPVLEGRSGPPELTELVQSVDELPAWFDPQRATHAGRLFFRTGMLGGMVLGARSLVAGYCSPAGNKPLVHTGALERDGARRLGETGRFVVEVHREDGMQPGAAGWQIALRVRLMHAMVRQQLWSTRRWPTGDWGEPLNQHDLLATAQLFSVVWVDGLRHMGLHVSRAETDDHLHLWRWVGEVMGVRPDWLPRTEPEAVDLALLILRTQAPPDEDAQRLVRALLSPEHPQGPPGLGEGLCRALMGPQMADALGLARTPWRHLPWLTRAVSAPVEAARRVHPRLEDRMVAAGHRYWEQAIAQGMAGRPARFRVESSNEEGRPGGRP